MFDTDLVRFLLVAMRKYDSCIAIASQLDYVMVMHSTEN